VKNTLADLSSARKARDALTRKYATRSLSKVLWIRGIVPQAQIPFSMLGCRDSDRGGGGAGRAANSIYGRTFSGLQLFALSLRRSAANVRFAGDFDWKSKNSFAPQSAPPKRTSAMAIPSKWSGVKSEGNRNLATGLARTEGKGFSLKNHSSFRISSGNTCYRSQLQFVTIFPTKGNGQANARRHNKDGDGTRRERERKISPYIKKLFVSASERTLFSWLVFCRVQRQIQQNFRDSLESREIVFSMISGERWVSLELIIVEISAICVHSRTFNVLLDWNETS